MRKGQPEIDEWQWQASEEDIDWEIYKWKPQKKTIERLDWMWGRVHSVPYDVPKRWLLYRCVQELGMSKDQAGQMVGYILDRARKAFFKEWRPWSLVDDTRWIDSETTFDNFEAWLKNMREYQPVYGKFSNQPVIVMVLYEAMAMRGQFEYYVNPYHVPKSAFKGDASIDLKWKIATFSDKLDYEFDKPIVILYFGDYETNKDTGSRAKGLTIPNSAFKDIQQWFITLQVKRKGWGEARKLVMERIGLNEEHITEWNLPDNPERPGEYQWEALSDEQAGGLITNAIEKYLSKAGLEDVERQEAIDQQKWKSHVDKLINEGVQ